MLSFCFKKPFFSYKKNKILPIVLVVIVNRILSSRGQRLSEKRGAAQFISSRASTPHIHIQIVYSKFYVERRVMFSSKKRICVNCSLLMTHPKKVGGRKSLSYDCRYGATDLWIIFYLSITMKTRYCFLIF